MAAVAADEAVEEPAEEVEEAGAMESERVRSDSRRKSAKGAVFFWAAVLLASVGGSSLCPKCFLFPHNKRVLFLIGAGDSWAGR